MVSLFQMSCQALPGSVAPHVSTRMVPDNLAPQSWPGPLHTRMCIQKCTDISSCRCVYSYRRCNKRNFCDCCARPRRSSSQRRAQPLQLELLHRPLEISRPLSRLPSVPLSASVPRDGHVYVYTCVYIYDCFSFVGVPTTSWHTAFSPIENWLKNSPITTD